MSETERDFLILSGVAAIFIFAMFFGSLGSDLQLGNSDTDSSLSGAVDLFKNTFSVSSLTEKFNSPLSRSNIITGAQVASSCITPPSNLVSWWPLDEATGANSIDFADNNNGNPVNSPTSVMGKVDTALSFDGTNYVSIPTNANIEFTTQPMSISFWIEPGTSIGNRRIISKGDDGVSRFDYMVFQNGNPLALGWGDALANILTGNVLTAGQFNFVTVTYAGSPTNDAHIYVNGAEITTGITGAGLNGFISLGNPLLLGANTAGANVNQFFNGKLDEVQIYNVALTLADHQAEFNAGDLGKCKVDEPICVPSLEVCDGVDNDCDLDIDEGGDSLCADSLFCNGAEVCSGVLGCEAGVDEQVDDGVVCTDDFCDEVNDVVVNTPNNANCDNGAFCDGAETCDILLDCQAGTPPNTADGVACTVDNCDEVNDVVVHIPSDGLCTNNDVCDGLESCDEFAGCQVGTSPTVDDNNLCTVDACDPITGVSNVPVNVDDGVECTIDSCDPITGTSHVPNDAACDDNNVCNGLETCDEFADCQIGTPLPGQGDACDTELQGVCSVGVNICDAVTGISCQATVLPGQFAEICDGLDNDCNGVVDDVDADNDGVNDCTVDQCLGSTADVAGSNELRPNHYRYDGAHWVWNAGTSSSPLIQPALFTMNDTSGCGCDPILECKPGNNNGEVKYGCTGGPNGAGTIATVGLYRNQQGWASDNVCFGGLSSFEFGENKPLFTNTDGAGWPDIIDTDNDNDGNPDGDDSLIDDADPEGTPGHGIPDWWEKKHPKK